MAFKVITQKEMKERFCPFNFSMLCLGNTCMACVDVIEKQGYYYCARIYQTINKMEF